MQPEKTSLIYFSPTSTTQLILKEIAKGIGKEISLIIDITSPQVRNQPAPEFDNSVVIIGAPVYAGRVAKDAADYFKTINGSGSLAIFHIEMVWDIVHFPSLMSQMIVTIVASVSLHVLKMQLMNPMAIQPLMRIVFFAALVLKYVPSRQEA